MAIRNCPECGGKVSTTRNDCPHCGYVFQLEGKNAIETVPSKGESDAPQEEPITTTKPSSVSEFDRIVSVIRRHDENDFLRGVYINIASDESTPTEFVDESQFSDIQLIKEPYVVAKMDVSITFNCSVGYDRQETYYERVQKKDANGRYYYEDVQKTRTVTDWQPFNGTQSGTYWETEINGEVADLAYDLFMGGRVKDEIVRLYLSDDEATALSDEEANEYGDISPMRNTLHSLQESAQTSCYLDVAKPGDHVKDEHYSGPVKLLHVGAAIVPKYKGSYTFNGQQYNVSGLASSDTTVIAEKPSDDNKQSKMINKKTRPLTFVVLGVATLFLTAIVLLLVLTDRADWTYPVGIALFALMIASVIFCVAVRNGVRSTLRKIVTLTKQTDKINLLDKLFLEKGWQPLTDDERDVVCSPSLRNQADGNKKGWQKFIYGITVRNFMGRSAKKSPKTVDATAQKSPEEVETTAKRAKKVRKSLSKKQKLQVMAICLACVGVALLGLGFGLAFGLPH